MSSPSRQTFDGPSTGHIGGVRQCERTADGRTQAAFGVATATSSTLTHADLRASRATHLSPDPSTSHKRLEGSLENSWLCEISTSDAGGTRCLSRRAVANSRSENASRRPQPLRQVSGSAHVVYEIQLHTTPTSHAKPGLSPGPLAIIVAVSCLLGLAMILCCIYLLVRRNMWRRGSYTPGPNHAGNPGSQSASEEGVQMYSIGGTRQGEFSRLAPYPSPTIMPQEKRGRRLSKARPPLTSSQTRLIMDGTSAVSSRRPSRDSSRRASSHHRAGYSAPEVPTVPRVYLQDETERTFVPNWQNYDLLSSRQQAQYQLAGSHSDQTPTATAAIGPNSITAALSPRERARFDTLIHAGEDSSPPPQILSSDSNDIGTEMPRPPASLATLTARKRSYPMTPDDVGRRARPRSLSLDSWGGLPIFGTTQARAAPPSLASRPSGIPHHTHAHSEDFLSASRRHQGSSTSIDGIGASGRPSASATPPRSTSSANALGDRPATSRARSASTSSKIQFPDAQGRLYRPDDSPPLPHLQSPKIMMDPPPPKSTSPSWRYG